MRSFLTYGRSLLTGQSKLQLMCPEDNLSFFKNMRIFSSIRNFKQNSSLLLEKYLIKEVVKLAFYVSSGRNCGGIFFWDRHFLNNKGKWAKNLGNFSEVLPSRMWKIHLSRFLTDQPRLHLTCPDDYLRKSSVKKTRKSLSMRNLNKTLPEVLKKFWIE